MQRPDRIEPFEREGMVRVRGELWHAKSSRPVQAGDRLRILRVDGLLRGMSKQKRDLPDTVGEFVGLTRLSVAAARAMRDEFSRWGKVVKDAGIKAE